MRFVTTLLIGTALALPAVAQTTHHTRHHKASHHTARHTATNPSGETVNDKGPYTPEANRAYNGGGAIIEGPPGSAPGASGMANQRGMSGQDMTSQGMSGQGMSGQAMAPTRQPVAPMR